MQRSKGYRKATEQVDRTKLYTPAEAIKLAQQTSPTKFDATVEVAMRLGVDPRKADQMVRGTVNLPHGTGKTARVLVFANGDKAEAAREAGADYVGSDDMLEKVSGAWLACVAVVATPDMMGKVGRLGRVLGRRGLMPNPRSGTIASPEDLPRVINERRGGRVDFRNDRTNLIHIPIGKASFTEEQIRANLLSAIDAVNRARPSGAKGTYIKSIAVANTMGPSIRLDINAAVAEAQGVAA